MGRGGVGGFGRGVDRREGWSEGGAVRRAGVAGGFEGGGGFGGRGRRGGRRGGGRNGRGGGMRVMDLFPSRQSSVSFVRFGRTCTYTQKSTVAGDTGGGNA